MRYTVVYFRNERAYWIEVDGVIKAHELADQLDGVVIAGAYLPPPKKKKEAASHEATR